MKQGSPEIHGGYNMGRRISKSFAQNEAGWSSYSWRAVLRKGLIFMPLCNEHFIPKELNLNTLVFGL